MLQKYSVIIAIICCFLSSAGGYKAADWQWSAKWSAHMTADAEANQKALEEVQEKQKRLTVELEHAYKTAKDLQDKYESDRIAAADSAQRLRDQIEKYRAAAGNDNSTTISVSANAATDRLVLANVLARADAAAGVLADYADANRNALINCNAEYNAVRKAGG